MKKTLLATAVLISSSAVNAAWTSPDGSLTIGGDAEINFDVVDRSFDNKNDVDNSPEVELNDDSRIKLMMQWMNAREDGAFITAKIEPLMKTNGDVALDDAYLMFGRESSWAFQIGRYEAMDLFPLGKDVAVFYADGSDGIGSGVYYYMAKEGRGRRGDAGQARIISEMGRWTAEVSTAYGDTLDLLQSSEEYFEDTVKDVESDHNSFLVRPAVNYLSDDGAFSVSFGGEYELSSDSVTAETDTGERFQVSDRYGLAATTTLIFGDLKWNTSIAMQDAKDAWEAQTFNTNIVYNDALGLGTSYAINKFEQKEEDTKSYVLYTAYTMPVMDFSNAAVTFALSYSETENAYGNKGQDAEATAFRTRFNYYF
ncbi:carbohydrate porin [uncultured Endozoicomonas sp.]|uniref:carbohydrate porin n=1 Tax=uncultured Endozoicomonas sp. TaxID=432652 RepID=UPI002638B4AF|nr:carbohydrate porin [uncultured Endozoicomonas sp.]